MGYSLPAAIGAKAAAPKRQVVCICGDGSFQMMLQELATISQNDLDVKIIVMRNDCLGLVREYQKRFYAGNFTAVQLHALPNIQAIGLAYNIPAFLLSEQEQVEPTVQAFLQTAGSAILEIIIRPDESSR